MYKITDITGITLSYAVSALSFFKEIDISSFDVSGFISFMTAAVGSCLTLTLAYKNYQDAKYRAAERHRIEAETRKQFGDNRPLDK